MEGALPSCCSHTRVTNSGVHCVLCSEDMRLGIDYCVHPLMGVEPWPIPLQVSGSAPPPPLRSFAELEGRPGCCRRLLRCGQLWLPYLRKV